MATLQGKAVKNTYKQVLQIGANNVGVSGTLQPVQDGTGTNTSLSLSTTAATVTGDLTITGDLIITGGGIQIQDLIDDTVASLIQNGTGITWAYNDSLRTLTPTITIATADGGAQADYFQFNTGANEASAVGKLKWNTTDGTMDIGLMGGNVVLQVGQEQVARVLNNSGSILTEAAYQAVKITSAQGQRLAVGLAQANNEANSKDTLGLVTENIANNQEGFVTTSGLVRQIDTTGDLQSEVWVDGDTLYLSPSIPGGITKVKPTAPQQTVIVGFVVYAHKNQGKIFVKVDNGYEISELHDVKITSVANNNILKYNSSLGVWENVSGTTTNIAEGTNLYYTQARFDSAFDAKSTTDLTEGTNLYFTETRATNNFDTNLAASTTTDLAEGTNLYYTNSRARLALDVTAGTGISYNNGTGVFTLGSIPNASLTNSSITINSQAVSLGGSVTLTTTNIAEGTNLYWTDARFDSRFGTKTTTNLAEGTNLYYTQARFNSALAAKSTTDLAEGTNLYYTNARARAAISESAVGLDYSSTSGVLSLTSGYSIPTDVKLGQYDTAYNRSLTSAAVTGTSTKTLTLTKQDASTITASWTDQGITTINGTANQIATSTVGNTTTVGFTNDVTFPNNVVVSGNLTINGTATYVNTQSISSKDPLFEVANDNNTTDAVDIGYYGRYFDSAQERVEFTGLFRDASDSGKYKIFSGLTVEPTNVVDTTGTGYTVGTLVANVEGNLAGTANSANVLSTSRSISATGDAAWTVNFNGSANATAALTLANTGVTASTYGTTTSVPTIAIDSKGRITSASNTNIAFPVTSVNGASGTVVLTTSNIAEGSNQYFTTGRAQSAISLTTTGTSGAATYTGGVINVPTYIGGSGTADEIAYFSTTGVISSLSTGTYPSLTELSYVKGLTSAVQPQIDSKLNLSGGTLTGALNGTSATFTGDITINNGSADGGQLVLASSGYSNWNIDNFAGAFRAYYGSSVALSIASTGAATFTRNDAGNVSATLANAYLNQGNLINFQQNKAGSTINAYIGHGGDNTGNFIINNGTQALTITNGGNVGIGTTTPDAKLKVTGTIYSDNNGLNNFALNSSGTNYGFIQNDGADKWSLGTGTSLSTLGTPVLTWTKGGNVGIGTSSPAQTLDVNGTIQISGSGNWLKYDTATAFFGSASTISGGTASQLGIRSGSDILFATGGASERMRITSTGNVGIGTSSPSSLLEIAATSPTLRINSTTGGNDGILAWYVNTNYIGDIRTNSGSGAMTFNQGPSAGWGGYMVFKTDTSERMRITSGGLVGIGNSSPGAALDIQYGSSSANISFRVRKADTITTFYVRGDGYVFAPSVYYFTTGSGANMFIDSDGAFYRSTSSLKYKTDVKDYTNGLNEVMKLRPVFYKGKTDGDKQFAGLIAEEVHELGLTEFVQYAEDGTPDALSYQNMIALAFKAIQELKAEIDILKAK